MILQDAIEVIRPSVVQFSVKTNIFSKHEQFGSGFIINDDGYIVTCAHVVQQAELLKKTGHSVTIGLAYPKIDDPEGITMKYGFYHLDATLLKVDQANDVALLKMNPNPFEISPISAVVIIGGDDPVPLYKECTTSTNRPRDGDSIAVSGYPLNSPTLITTVGNLASGWASSDRQVTEDGENKIVQSDTYLVDISVNPGNSGGPTYRSEDGRVIGVCTAYQNAPLMFIDQKGGWAEIDERPVGINSGLCIVTPIKYVLDLLKSI